MELLGGIIKQALVTMAISQMLLSALDKDGVWVDEEKLNLAILRLIITFRGVPILLD